LGLLDGFYGFGVKIDKKKIDFMYKPLLNFSYHGSGRILNNNPAGNMSPVKKKKSVGRFFFFFNLKYILDIIQLNKNIVILAIFL